ncbi:PREDICTED: bcl-2-binding component 3 isoform X2 [Myotis brandtii]|nr:PREDICTED: bcl-2-binding component 3 isoform X2 [Myotis brandtii]XP_014403551.1 PREDICTED: bcl-2-binding component 3 isoform X2 [Myotis brandtii]
MARARQEGSSPEPVEGLARDGPRPFPLSRLVPSAVSCGLCEPGLPPAPATPARLPAAYLCAPTALPAVTAALGAPRWPGGPRSRPRGPHPNEARGAAATRPLALAGPVQSHPGTAALAQGPRSPGDGAQLGACTCLVDVGDLGGRPLPQPDALASTGDISCTM